MMFDLYENVKSVITLKDAGVVKLDLVGEKIDTKGFQSIAFVVMSGTITDGTQTFKLTESSDNTTFTDVASADLIGTAPVFAATDDDTVKAFGYKGPKRYLQLASTVSGAPVTGGTFAAIAVLGNPLRAPTV